MRSKDVVEFLACALAANENVWLLGAPGIGKTEVCEEACRRADIYLWRHKPGITMDPVDVNGLPYVDEKTISRWARSQLWPTADDVARIGKRITIFVDELSQASTTVQCAYLQASQSKRIGEMEIDPSITFLATGNRMQDRAGVGRIITPLLDRFTKINMDVSNEDWQAWAIHNGVAPEVRGFLNLRPSLLHQFDPDNAHLGSCTPRSWVAVSNLLKVIPERMMMEAASGRVGEGPAAELMGFVRTYRHLPNMDAILKDPTKAPIPSNDPSIMYALCTALAEKSKTLPSLDGLATYGRRFAGEFSALAFRDTFAANCARQTNGKLKADAKLIKGEMAKWAKDHGDILFTLTS